MKKITFTKKALALFLAIAMVLTGLYIPKSNVRIVNAEEETEAIEVVEEGTEEVISESAVAKIGNEYYESFAGALTAAKDSDSAVAITLLKDISDADGGVPTGGFVVQNTAGKKITIDGINKSERTITAGTGITTLFDVQCEFELKNVTVDYKGTEAAIKINAPTTTSLTQVTINAEDSGTKSSDAYVKHAVIDVLAPGTHTLNLSNTDITMTMPAEGAHTDSSPYQTIIRTNEGLANNKNIDGRTRIVHINLVNSTLDATAAVGRIGIWVTRGTQGNILLDNSHIKTTLLKGSGSAVKNRAIYGQIVSNVALDDKVILTGGSTLTCTNGVADPFNFITCVARIGNEFYETFAEAVTAANESASAVTIELFQNITVTDKFTINNSNNKITIDGKGHTVTAGTDVTSLFDVQSEFELKNVTVDYKGKEAAIKINAPTITSLTNVIINAEDTGTSSSKALVKDALIDVLAAGTHTLNLTNTNITMTSGYNADGSPYQTIIRTNAGLADSTTLNPATRTVNINLTNSTIDATGALGRIGIWVTRGTQATVILDNSHIKTQMKEGSGSNVKNRALYAQTSVQVTPTIDDKVILTGGSTLSCKNGTDGPINFITCVAKIGETYYTLSDAVAAANASAEEVTIELLQDITISSALTFRNNNSGVSTTIDGKGYEVTTSGAINVFVLQGSPEGTGTYEFKNMTVKHGSSKALVQMNERSVTTDGVKEITHTTKKATVRLTNVNIENVNNGGYEFGLITTLPTAVDADMTLDLNKVDVTMNIVDEENKLVINDNAAIIRTGNPDQVKAVDINLTNCNFNVSGAAGISGIKVLKSATADIALDNTTIITDNMASIEAHSQATSSTITLNGNSSLDSAANDPIVGYNAQIGNVIYQKFNQALNAANGMSENVTITLLKDISISACNIGKSDKSSTHKISINGDGHTITSTGGNHAFRVYTDASFMNMTILHKNYGSAIQIYKEGVDVQLSEMTIDATQPKNSFKNNDKDYTDTYAFALINFDYTGTTEMTTSLALSDVNIYMATPNRGVGDCAIIRTGNAGATKAVYIEIEDSVLDASVSTTYEQEEGEDEVVQSIGAAGRNGIRIMNGTQATVEMIDSTIRTLDVVPIYDGSYSETGCADINKTRCILDIASEEYNTTIAQVINTLYTDISEAIKAVNSAKNNVTLDFLENYTHELTDDTKNAFVLDNANGKDVTVDGNMYVITAQGGNNTIRFNDSTTDTMAVKNMTLIHKNKGAAIQVADNNDASVYNVNIVDVTITATEPSEKGYEFALINVLPKAVSYLNVVRTNVTMATEVAGSDREAAIIRTGNGSNATNASANAKTVYITLEESHLDATGATGRTGIVVMDTTTATVKLIDSSIKTLDTYPIKIYNKELKKTEMIEVDAATELSSEETIYTDNPILDTDGCKNTSEDFTESAITLGQKPSTLTEGYIFGGWFKKESCKPADAFTEGNTQTKELAASVVKFAKLVPQCVMDVKAQLSTHLFSWDGESATTGSIRFVTTIDSLNYQEVGFEYKVVAANGQVIMEDTNSSNKVYKRLNYLDGEELLSYLPDDEFCAESEYFKAFTIQGIPSAYFDATITVRPFWKTKDGATVYGETVEKTVNQGIEEGLNLSNSIAGNVKNYTNRVVLVSDMHYTTELSRTEYNDRYSFNLGMAGLFGKPNDGASVAAGKTFGFGQKEKLDEVLKDLQALNSDNKGIDSVLVLGDLTLDDYGFRGLENAGGNYLKEFKTYFMDTVAGTYGSCYALAGNHDSYSNTDWSSVIGTDRQHVVEVEGSNVIFVMLDTFEAAEASSASGSAYKGIEKDDLDFLKDVLDNDKYADKTIFLCAHRYSGTSSTSTYQKEFNELINSEPRIVCMFDAHEHQNKINDTLANCPIVNIGGYGYKGTNEAGESDYNYYDISYAWGYQVVEWNDEEVHIYHVKPARTYEASNGTIVIEEDIIEGERTFQINK